MKKIIIIKIFLFCFLIISSKVYSFPDSDSINKCKVRLPNEINSYQPVLVPVLSPYGNRLYFDRKSHPDNTNKIKDFDDIWYSDKLSQDMWSEPLNLKELNTFDSDVLFWISPDGRTGLVYGIYTEKNNQKKQGFSFTEYEGTKWTKPQQLNIKNFYNDSLHFYANLSADGKILIMAVSRKDAIGGLDIYVSFLNEKNQEWSLPMNIGTDVNTKGNEQAPILAYDNKTLYFSSNRLPGEGEQDLYYTRRLDDSWKKWSKPQNLGKDINTKYGEQGFWMSSLGDSAIIVSYDSVSKRKGLYWICLPKELQPEPFIILSGNINFADNESKERKVDIFVNDKLEQTIKIGMLKNYAIILPKKINYNIRLESEGFGIVAYELDLKNITQSINIKHDFNFQKKLSEQYNSTIYFETNSYELTEDSNRKLNDILKMYKDGKIEISGYTDETGTEYYNMRLSKKRAEKVQEYLINKGLKRNKILIHYYGENSPISEDFDKNRRVEILIK